MEITWKSWEMKREVDFQNTNWRYREMSTLHQIEDKKYFHSRIVTCRKFSCCCYFPFAIDLLHIFGGLAHAHSPAHKAQWYSLNTFPRHFRNSADIQTERLHQPTWIRLPTKKTISGTSRNVIAPDRWHFCQKNAHAYATWVVTFMMNYAFFCWSSKRMKQ